MRKTWEKLSAILLAVILVLTMMMSVYAEGVTVKKLDTVPSATDTGAVEISGLTVGDQVTFYQIVKANYENGFKDYEAVKDSTIDIFNEDGNAIYPTAEEISALALDTENLTTSVGPITATTDKVTQELAAGEWLVIVTPKEATTIYNPMVASVYYTNDDGQAITSGKVGVNESYIINSTTSYVKKSTTDLDKVITGGKDGEKGEARTIAPDANGKGDDLAIGDTVDFKLSTTVPSYSEEYKNLKFIISDTLDEGLDLNESSIEIQIAGKTVEAAGYTIKKSAHDFEITFTEDYLRALAKENEDQRKLTVTYSATLNEKATTNFSANENTAKITFTNKPGENQKAEEIEKKTYQYTFEIDGSIGGNETTKEHRTHELIKTGEGGEVQDGAIVDDGWSETTVKSPLKDAKFTLTNKATGKEYTELTDANGYMNFKGLDAGEYILKETEAPKGYSLNTREIPVVITAEYNADGTLKSYTITVDGNNTSTYEATYNNDGTVNEIHEKAVKSTEIKNTKMNNLPSTGGMGTYLFTFLGVLLMVVGSYSYRKNKKTA
ncbi:MAG: isopeptide-forming domain-containing fimbrial protein [Eubacteriales bacterium]|nr:isopeptide-forming domain-containing fimbrial protein [Eubacteriales bacterium]